MARIALSSSSICAGKASRKKPEMRSVTSTRGRPSFASGMISKPVTRQLDGSHTGLAPMRASACAMSSPPVRMLEVPQAERPSALRILPEVLEVAREKVLGGLLAQVPGGGRGHGAVVERIEIAARGQHVEPAARRRAGEPGATKRPARPFRSEAISLGPQDAEVRADAGFDGVEDGACGFARHPPFGHRLPCGAREKGQGGRRHGARAVPPCRHWCAMDRWRGSASSSGRGPVQGWPMSQVSGSKSPKPKSLPRARIKDGRRLRQGRAARG